jgi:hypothetical protein
VTDLRELRRFEHHFWRAPSAHNTQPWIVDYGPGRVELRYDPDRALAAGDPTGRDLFLSLGAFVEAVLVVASASGIPVAFVSEIDVPRQRVGAFLPAPESYRTSFTLVDIAQRETSRLPYAPGRLTAEDLAAARGQVPSGAELHELPTVELVALVPEADRHLYSSPAIVAELRGWLRLRATHPRYETDGLTYECLGLRRTEAAALSFLLHPAVHPLAVRLRVHRLFSASTTKLLEGDGSALALVADSSSPERVVENGRGLYRVWLELGRRGLRTHPLSQILDCPATGQELASHLGVAGRHVLSVFRAGRSKAPHRSHRLR